jgi:hypothetical protein
VVLDSNWESSAAGRMEMSPHVPAYAKNDHPALVPAVSMHGGFARWIFAPMRKPHALATELEKFHRMAREQMAAEGYEG